MADTPALSYKEAGVDIDAGNALVERIKPLAKRTHRPEVIGGLGGFGALCTLPTRYREPVLVATTDGVGTKLRLAMQLHQHHSIGIDLVAMCVNDLLVQGAEPLLFLDYYATSRLEVALAAQVIEGIAEGCQQANCALAGGETAEMPGMYKGKEYDLAGFCVGVVERSQIIDGTRVRPGDALIALASSGPHSNGYALIHKILEQHAHNPATEMLANQSIASHLMAPTRIYVASILTLIQQCDVHAMAHVTGGGFWENIPRILPSGSRAVIEQSRWQWPAIFSWLQQQGNITLHEMYRTFNCGVGMIIILPAVQVEPALSLLKGLGEQAWKLGDVVATDSCQQVVINP